MRRLKPTGRPSLFRAKEVLGGHTCLAGDVPPALLTVGGAAEVDEHCRKLIEVVGKGGGFILSNGCTMPPDSKHENVKALIDSVGKYGRN